MNNLDVCMALKQTCDALEKEVNKRLRGHGLTLAQSRILAFLYENGHAATQKAIEEHLGVAHPTTVGLIERLAKKGLVSCEQDKNDRRMKQVRLTGSELSLHREIMREYRLAEERMLHGLSREQLGALTAFLGVMRRNLDD